ncbi:MAG: hypothetical protein HY698_20595 [Deltaproteobacteria bacterium]|nr:hypothetical protein [Deltaproteobacteria bacterium]
MRASFGLPILLFGLAAGCEPSPGHPPIARITISPRAIPAHDGFRTELVLDGTTSADPIDDPDGANPLGYEWKIVGDEVRMAKGDDRSEKITVRFLGERPATVFLTVSDDTGLFTTARMQVQLTVMP